VRPADQGGEEEQPPDDHQDGAGRPSLSAAEHDRADHEDGDAGQQADHHSAQDGPARRAEGDPLPHLRDRGRHEIAHGVLLTLLMA
jgi:hypothetical protein